MWALHLLEKCESQSRASGPRPDESADTGRTRGKLILNAQLSLCKGG